MGDQMIRRSGGEDAKKNWSLSDGKSPAASEAMPTIAVRYLKYSPGEAGLGQSADSVAAVSTRDRKLSDLCTG